MTSPVPPVSTRVKERDTTVVEGALLRLGLGQTVWQKEWTPLTENLRLTERMVPRGDSKEKVVFL